MRRFVLLALMIALPSGCRHAPEQVANPATSGRAECVLSGADLAANRALTWQQFDQQSGSPTSWRALIDRECFEAAATAYADYLAFGPPVTGERWQTTARFHLGQSLAHAGRNDEAARVIATARRENEVGGMNWNLYIQGTYGFLTRDRQALATAAADLRSRPGLSNAINAGVLAGLLHCWERPYREAASPSCVAASGYTMPRD